MTRPLPARANSTQNWSQKLAESTASRRLMFGPTKGSACAVPRGEPSVGRGEPSRRSGEGAGVAGASMGGGATAGAPASAPPHARPAAPSLARREASESGAWPPRALSGAWSVSRPGRSAQRCDGCAESGWSAGSESA